MDEGASQAAGGMSVAASASRTLAVVPGTGGYVDNVARWLAFKAEHPDAEHAYDRPFWTGSIKVGGRRRQVSRIDLGALLDALDALATIEAEARQIERECSGWRVWLSSLDRWWAVRQGPDARNNPDDR
jgi:hypothetical protein